MSDALITHSGGCHCGAVRFTVQAPADIRAVRCNCSMCQRTGHVHLLVPASRFHLESGEDALSTYTFNTHTAKHHFCSRCGCRSFYVPRSNPDGFSVDVRSLDPGTVASVSYVYFDGQNWEDAVSGIAHLSREDATTPSAEEAENVGASDVPELNRRAWNRAARSRERWSQPVSPEIIAGAREGELSLLLTPTIPVPAAWYPPLQGARVLGLAASGGQQSPCLAAAGADVTVLDLSPEQLAHDRSVAEREGLTLRLEEGDMRDLSRFPDDHFDLVFHPCSNSFIPDIQPVWDHVARVLKPGGTLLAGFVNGMLYSIPEADLEAGGPLTLRYPVPYSDLEHLPKGQLAARIAAQLPIEFGHSLEEQLGGITRAGLAITGLFEDTSGYTALDAVVRSMIAVRAVLPA